MTLLRFCLIVLILIFRDFNLIVCLFQQLQTYLGNVYDEILSLRHFETDLYKKISEESDRRKNIEKLKEERGHSGKLLHSFKNPIVNAFLPILICFII